jgi:DNA-directed RNA polymerase subunit RPC12/RpoP
MDVIFKCPHCEQELAVDASGAGNEIECPSCAQMILIPAPDPSAGDTDPALAVADSAAAPAPAEATEPPGEGAPAALPRATPASLNPIAASAAAKVERHFSVPVHEGPAEVLVKKQAPPLEVVAREAGLKVKVKTIRQIDCVEVGRDRYDENLSQFLSKIGQENVISINTVTYTYIDIGSQKLLTSYGVTVIYRG